MLDNAPAHDDRPDTSLDDDDSILCAACERLVTRGRWRIVRREAHEHTVFNPAGRLFSIVCFKEAPGVVSVGVSSNDFTWFPGYRWTVAACDGCGIHIGWRYDGGDVFFGLIRPRLSDRKT